MNMEHSIAEGSFICGSPDTFLAEFTFGEPTQKQALNSLRLFNEHVMPEIRKLDRR
jgi:hypothetical protein